MAKRLTDKEKKEIINLFNSGISIEQISQYYNCTKLTISRNIKKNVGEAIYKQLVLKNKTSNKLIDNQIKKINSFNKEQNKTNVKSNIYQEITNDKNTAEYFKETEFFEIAPLNIDIDNKPQKDLSSIPISDIDFPKTVFMIVDKKVELEIKYLKDYPKWQFLSQDELKRKTIEIYFDLKIAKSFCGKEQKVIKVPNTNVFRLVAPILVSRGISRIISSDKLIAL